MSSRICVGIIWGDGNRLKNIGELLELLPEMPVMGQSLILSMFLWPCMKYI